MYQAHIEGKQGLEAEYRGDGNYGNVGWNTWVRLRNYKWGQLVKEIQMMPTEDYRDWYYVVHITEFGLHYYRREWQRYRELYPDVEALEPEG